MNGDARTPMSAVAPKSASDVRRAPSRRFSLRSAPLELRMLALAIVIAVALSLLSPYFLKTNNLLNLLDQSVVVGIVSIGMTFVILTGGIDLSVGSRGRPHRRHPRPFAASLSDSRSRSRSPCFRARESASFSGLLIAYFDLAAFVITLGVMAIGRSLAYIFSGQTSISDIPPQLNDLVYTTVLGVQTNVLDAAAALCARLGLSHLHQGRAHDLCGWLQPRGGAHGRPRRAVLQRAALCGLGRALRCRRDADVVADPVDRPARRHRARTGRHRRGGDRRGEPLWRPRHDHRHADRRVHHGDDPQRPQPARRLAVLAGIGDRRHHHRRRSGGTALEPANAR